MKYFMVHFAMQLVRRALYHLAYLYGLMHGRMGVVIGAAITTVCCYIFYHHHYRPYRRPRRRY